jgi:hypothetical protein
MGFSPLARIFRRWWPPTLLSAGLVLALLILGPAPVAAHTATLPPAAGADGVALDSLGCTLTVVAPHIDHSGTHTDGMMKAHSAETCDHPVGELIVRTCLSYWNGARWVRVACHFRDTANTSSVKADVFHAPGCDLGHHRYRNVGHVGILNPAGSVIMAHQRIAIATRC